MSNFRIVETEGHFQPQYSFFERRLFKKNYLKWNVILINETFWYERFYICRKKLRDEEQENMGVIKDE
jgi:hypothetical protein